MQCKAPPTLLAHFSKEDSVNLNLSYREELSERRSVKGRCSHATSWARVCLAVTFSLVTTIALAQVAPLTTIHSFDNTDGYDPFGELIQATDGNLFGTTYLGGANGLGSIFRITPNGTFTPLYSFCAQSGCSDGEQPNAALLQASDGSLYGTTLSGGLGYGTIFKITPAGKFSVFHSFDDTDGEGPYDSLIQASDGNLYGTTRGGGANGDGTVFKITLGGTLTTLHSFDCTDGCGPIGALVQAANGNLYGTTFSGGAYGAGTIFRVNPNGTLTSLYSFCSQSGCVDGSTPQTALTQASDGNLYGTTTYGGANGEGGTIFKITARGLKTVYSFCSRPGCADGESPSYGSLIQATDGSLYGATASGGSYGYGTVFKITLGGKLSTLYSFCAQPSCTDGEGPITSLVQDTNGKFYGATATGGAFGYGTVFALSIGLGPFVETMPTSGKVGATVRILGTNLAGASSVTFNGTAAAFSVNKSGSLITTTVPTGATTGTVQVTTPLATLKSNVVFRVQP